MNAASPAGARSSGPHHAAPNGGPTNDARELWPREFGRDGVSGLLTLDRAKRARDVSRPTADDERMAAEVLADLLARVDGRRASTASRAGGRPR